MAGYFAFPPPSSQAATVTHDSDSELEVDKDDDFFSSAERAWEDRQKDDAAAHARKLQSEREQALLGEIEWVRNGGWLRDAYGRRDKARTLELREEIRVRDEEQRAIEQWHDYEIRWRALLASDNPIDFQDVPWPVFPRPTCVDELSPDAIRQFIVAPLRVRTNKVSLLKRLRHLLLRWHPDKLTGVVARTIERDLGAVLAGINAVFYVLKGMQDSERSL